MARIPDDSSERKISSQEKAMYKEEYRKGAELFQKALHKYAKSEDLFQKGEFKDVMEDMLLVLNDTARALKQAKLQKQSDQIAQDYETYQNSPTPDTEKTLDTDLEKAKKIR